ncbi:glutathione S-transferase [Coralloluteibacterium stylophorae]|uniref:glutathione transferase n=1 Tax=Coralloluteibacterium stylophorae TaxID=1776034 RepID=A0A8J8AXV0_9GAMM|nr:glutathione S-transferase [Coralloluteibacterium stylophorae]MBS7455598.1 glutathione S-transferase [Coralloluteibacterium stylophorae]
MIVVHHLDNSRSQRVVWLLEELGLDYSIREYRRGKDMRAPESLKQVHPLGKAPVLEDGGVVVAESGAIIEYLLQRYDTEGRLAPPRDSEDGRRFTYWLHFAEGSLMPPLLLTLVFGQVKARAPALVRPIARGIADKVLGGFVRPQLSAQFDFMERTLAGQAWFAGERFSAADIQMSFPLEAAAARGGLDQRYPHLRGFLARIRERPAWKRAAEKGGEFGALG